MNCLLQTLVEQAQILISLLTLKGITTQLHGQILATAKMPL